ncbi:hypothetical protein GF323_01995 [Candidatus Woesearchaeota archaeon]|nr:hypothetical protein [Candidatus Woesearchaeota archaeon]
MEPFPVVGSIVDDFKRELEEYLLSKSYNLIVRCCEDGCEIIEYYQGTPQPAILGIHGGNLCLLLADKGENNFENLTISVKDGLNQK